jgi:hypothetical protein
MSRVRWLERTGDVPGVFVVYFNQVFPNNDLIAEKDLTCIGEYYFLDDLEPMVHFGSTNPENQPAGSQRIKYSGLIGQSTFVFLLS